MSDLRSTIHAARTAAGNTALPKWQRVVNAIQSFKGLTLTGLSPTTARVVETNLAAVNRVLARYKLQTFDDYATIGDVELQQILDIVVALLNKLGDLDQPASP